MCFQGIDFHKLRLVPIISVGAVMIRLWIISLDHCFPLLRWLGAIHLPPSSGVTDAVKLPLLFTPLLSLLPPTFPDPVTCHDLHLSSTGEQYLLEGKLRCSQCQPCVFMDRPEMRKHLSSFYCPHTLTFISVESEMTNHSCYFFKGSHEMPCQRSFSPELQPDRSHLRTSCFKVLPDLLHLSTDNVLKLKV